MVGGSLGGPGASWEVLVRPWSILGQFLGVSGTDSLQKETSAIQALSGSFGFVCDPTLGSLLQCYFVFGSFGFINFGFILGSAFRIHECIQNYPEGCLRFQDGP